MPIHKAPVQTLRKESTSSTMVPMKHDWPKCSSCCPTFILVTHKMCNNNAHSRPRAQANSTICLSDHKWTLSCNGKCPLPCTGKLHEFAPGICKLQVMDRQLHGFCKEFLRIVAVCCCSMIPHLMKKSLSAWSICQTWMSTTWVHAAFETWVLRS